TLVYRIEQVLLIHVPSGIVLQHVVAEDAPSADPDQVGAMLKALDAFSREAFRLQDRNVHLDELSIGDMKLWINWDPGIAIAALVRGIAPRQVGDLIRETRERIALAHRAELIAFASDVSPFRNTRPELEQCLQEHRTEAPHRAQIILALLGLFFF